jgi:hypothetical protein
MSDGATRHALGAFLFEQDRTENSEAVYREDLGLGGELSRATIHPDNVWSLKGLVTVLTLAKRGMRTKHDILSNGWTLRLRRPMAALQQAACVRRRQWPQSSVKRRCRPFARLK